MEDIALTSKGQNYLFSSINTYIENDSTLRKNYVIVGDRIKERCISGMFISAETAESIAHSHRSPLTLYIGQGLSDEQLIHLYSLSQAKQTLIDLVPKQRPQRASLRETHKHENCNVAISKVIDNGNGTYSSALMIDDTNAELSDHLTGQHISGMMIVEAARQMSIATAEQFYINPLTRKKVNFLTNRMHVTYHDLMLPVQTEILCIPVAVKRSGPVNFRFTVNIQFRQQSKILATLEFDTSVIDARYFHLKEMQLLHRYISLLG